MLHFVHFITIRSNHYLWPLSHWWSSRCSPLNTPLLGGGRRSPSTVAIHLTLQPLRLLTARNFHRQIVCVRGG